MTVQGAIQRGYTVHVRRVPETKDTYQISYIPRDLARPKGTGGPKQVGRHGQVSTSPFMEFGFKALARARDDEIQIEWEQLPTDQRIPQEEWDQDVRNRVLPLHQWIDRLDRLIGVVQGWAAELGWSVRLVDKAMKDSEIGNYRVPALLMQKDMMKVALEPIGRSAPGADGIVDLYLLPAYDDIASLYFYDNRWHLQYPRADRPAAASLQPKPMSKKVFREALDELMKHAG